MAQSEKARITTPVKTLFTALFLFFTLLFLLWWGIHTRVVYYFIEQTREVLRGWAFPFGIGQGFESSSDFTILLLGVFVSALFSIVVFLVLAFRYEARKIAGQLTEELFASREWFRELYDNGPVPYLMLSPEGRVRQPNKAAIRLFENTADVLYDKPFEELFTKDFTPDAGQYVSFFLRAVPVDKKEAQIMRGDGTARWVILSIFVIPNKRAGSHYGLVTLVDITERKEMERTKQEFLSLASHELRTPLASMKWYLEVLLGDDFGALNDEQQRYARKVYIANARLIALVDMLLSVSRIEMGTLKIEPQKVDIVELIDQVAEDLSPQVSLGKLSVYKKYEEDSLTIIADPKFLRVIVQNLISNAVKYTPEGGSVTLSLQKDTQGAVFSVEDTGLGIPKEAQEKIFSKMYRAENIKKVDTKGAGLGLYITKSFVETLGGSIYFTSIEGEGTTFTVRLPYGA